MGLFKSYLKSLSLSNFASIGKGHIKFVPAGITIIQGENNTGKTNVLRALKALAGDTPFSEKRIRFGCREAFLSLVFVFRGGEISLKVTRDREAQRAFIEGHGKAKDIQGARALKKELKESFPEIVFVDPFDTPDFLISGRGDTLYKKIISMFGLDTVVPVIAKVKTSLKALDGKLAEVNKMHIEVSEDLEKWNLLAGDIVDIRERFDGLTELYEKTTLEKNRILTVKDKVEVLLSALNLLRKSEKSISLLEARKRGSDAVTKVVSAFSNIVRNMKIIQVLELEARKSAVSNLISRLKVVNEKTGELSRNLSEISESLEGVDICPFCGRAYSAG